MRHDAKFSPEVLEALRSIAADPVLPLPGPIVDPFAGTGLIATIGRDDVHGIELEPEWAEMDSCVIQGDALERSSYPPVVGSVVTSPCYGNRFADQYLGPVCSSCDGSGYLVLGPDLWDSGRSCEACGGSGRDGRGRFGYAISLGRKVSDGSAAGLQWGPKYRAFHTKWLRLIAMEILEPGARRLVLNMSDHHRLKERQYVVQWWIEEAGRQGFRLVEAVSVGTQRFGMGSNQQSKPESEMVLVFDLLSRTVAG